MSIEPVELTRKLVQINSENYESDESLIGTFCSSILRQLGFQIFEEPMNHRNINIIGVKSIDGNVLSEKNINNYRFLMFSGHMDTVPGYLLANSEKAEIREGKIYGRGACDMKSGIACFLSAIKNYFTAGSTQQHASDHAQQLGLIVVLSVREEIGCEGVRYIRSPFISQILTRAELCILAEPSDSELIVAHNGYSSYSLRFHGKSAHSGTAYAGDNAIYKASKFLVDLEKYYNTLQTRSVVVPELGKPQINPGIIRGGTQINIVPNFCDIEVDRRIMFGETAKDAAEEILQIAKKYDSAVEFKVFDKGNPYVYPSTRILREEIKKWFPNLSQESIEKNDRMLGTLLKITGKSIRYLPAYTEADHYFSAFGIPTIILGPGSINAAHIDKEYVEIRQIVECTWFFQQIIERYFRKGI